VTATGGGPVLTLDDLRKSFGDVRAVDGVSAEVRPGEIFGLLGPNGAGKTTTIRMITGELRPDSGRVLLHGRPLTSSVDDRARVGLCPQELVLWEKLTCREQLEFVGRMYGMPRHRVRERAALLLEGLGLEAKAGVRGGALSGGQKRRLNIALALIHDPELVVLDEPGAGLDPQSRVLVRDLVRTVARTAAVVITTHDMDEADRLSDRVAIIDGGRVLACDAPATLRRELGQERIVTTTRSPSLEDVFLQLTGRSLRS
jgi:ABC-2 type transport system ATP-binding protein